MKLLFFMTYETLKQTIPPEALAPLIDHTNLFPTATTQDISTLCEEARQYGFASVCVSQTRVALSSRRLKGSGVAVCTVVGFPSGVSYTEAKKVEARRAVHDGATEIDMVVNVGALKDGEHSLFLDDILGVAGAVYEAGGKILKCIIEAGYLTPEEVAQATRHVITAAESVPGVHFFTKTSTGMALQKLLVTKYDGTTVVGARVQDIEIISGEYRSHAEQHLIAHETVPALNMGIKGAGGAATYDDALKLLYAMSVRSRSDLHPSRQRLGASAGKKIVTST